MFTLNNTPEALHSWVFYKSFGSFFFFVYLLLAVNNCVKNAFKYSKVRCALGMQRECCDPFLHSVSLFLLFSCAILQRLRMPVCEDAEDDGEVGQKLNWANRPESIYQILECSLNVPWRRWRSPTGTFG